MRFTVTMAQDTYRTITAHLNDDPNVEGAGFAFGRMSATAAEQRLLVREFRPVAPQYILCRDSHSMKIDSQALAIAMKYANDSDQCLLFTHSHPPGYDTFSTADDAHEPHLFKSAYIRVANPGPHASIVFPSGGNPFARVWLPDGSCANVDRIRVVGDRFLFFDKASTFSSPEFFDRQVRAFGQNTQSLLTSLHIAVVGAGGTGSATVEQLVRLGVGKLSIYDRQKLEKSNVTRVFGSRTCDEGKPKAEILATWGESIGTGSAIVTYAQHITREDVARTLRDADIIFGCTDDEWGRSVLNDISIRYMIPVIDMAVKITSEAGTLHSVCGRVTVLTPGAACLFCRGRISPAKIKAESDHDRSPAEATALRKEGYAPDLEERDPSVVTFTSAIASLATTELLHRLTGFMGAERRSTEVLYFIERGEIRRSATPSSPDCRCMQPQHVGIGDTRDFLGTLWASSP